MFLNGDGNGIIYYYLTPALVARCSIFTGAVATQRRNYRLYISGSEEASGMTAARVQSLEDLDFQWTVRRHWIIWFKYMRLLVVYSL